MGGSRAYLFHRHIAPAWGEGADGPQMRAKRLNSPGRMDLQTSGKCYEPAGGSGDFFLNQYWTTRASQLIRAPSRTLVPEASSIPTCEGSARASLTIKTANPAYNWHYTPAVSPEKGANWQPRLTLRMLAPGHFCQRDDCGAEKSPLFALFKSI